MFNQHKHINKRQPIEWRLYFLLNNIVARLHLAIGYFFIGAIVSYTSP